MHSCLGTQVSSTVNNNTSSTMVIKDSFLDKLAKQCKNKSSIFIFDGKEWKLDNLDNLLDAKKRYIVGEKGEEGIPGPRGPKGFPGESFLGDDILKTTNLGLNSGKNGMYNFFGGYNAGKDETSDENTYVGFNAGTLSSLGSNTFVGSEAGKHCTGSKNTFIGDSVSANDLSSGSNNFFGGAESGFKNIVGSGNVFLGAVSGANNTEGSWNVFIGQSCGHSNETGTNNIFIGANSGISNIHGNSCICIGDSADTSSDVPINQIVIGQGVTGIGDNTITFPNNLRQFPHGTEVNFSSTGGGCLYPVSSSIRWKENVKNISELIDTEKIYDLRPITFNPSQGHGNPEELHFGLIAEEVERILPILVPKDDMGNPASVRYSLLSVLLLEEIKKLKRQIDSKI